MDFDKLMATADETNTRKMPVAVRRFRTQLKNEQYSECHVCGEVIICDYILAKIVYDGPDDLTNLCVVHKACKTGKLFDNDEQADKARKVAQWATK